MAETDFLIDSRLIVGVAEIAELFSVGRSTVTQWESRRQHGFPMPVRRVAAGALWNVAEVARWYASYVPSQGARPGKPPSTEQLAQYDTEGS